MEDDELRRMLRGRVNTNVEFGQNFAIFCTNNPKHSVLRVLGLCEFHHFKFD
jgi:hypothetical protein